MKALQDYIECALWSSVHYESEECDGIPFDQVDAEIAPETLKIMEEELANFMEEVETIAEEIETESGEFPISDKQVAHDFWLTRNGHGAGFWDRGLGELGDKLTSAAEAWGSIYLYLGDDGLIYQE